MRWSLKAGVAGLLFLVASAPAHAASSDTYRQLNLFGDVFERVRAEYVDEVDDAEMIEAAINGMLAALDPHSSYLNPEKAREMQVQTQGKFGGLGMEVTMENGLVKVVAPIDGTPAARAGIKAGDVVTQLDGESIMGLTLSQAVERMRGPINTDIVLTLARDGAEAPFDITLTREIIKITPVRHRVEDGIGYLRIASFNEQTASSLEEAMADIREKTSSQAKGFVLDLRGNPGGLLDQSVAVSDAFLDRGEIVSTRGRDMRDIQRYNAKPGDLADGRPIIVLINDGSASASEIVAGALQDHKRAIVVGTRSFGKGSVQSVFPLGAEGALRLTTALYYTPSGRSIQAKGIDPDIEVPQAKLAYTDAPRRRSEASLRGHINAPDGDESEAAPAAGAGVPAGDASVAPDEPERPVGEDRENNPGRVIIGEEEVEDYQLAYAFDLIRGLALMQPSSAVSD